MVPSPTSPGAATRYIDHDPKGPYAFKAEKYAPEALQIIANIKHHWTAVRYVGFRQLVENGRDAFLLVNLGWLHLKMKDEFGALQLFKEAKLLAQPQKDALVEARIAELEDIVMNLQQNDDLQWDSVGDGYSGFALKWSPIVKFDNESNRDPDLQAQLRNFVDRWGGLKNDSQAISTAYARYLAVQTNELEGIYKLTADSVLRIMRSGIRQGTLDISRRTAIYGSTNRDSIVRVCGDTLKALDLVVNLAKASRGEDSLPHTFQILSLSNDDSDAHIIESDFIKNLHQIVTRHCCITEYGDYLNDEWAFCILTEPGVYRRTLVRSELDPEDGETGACQLIQYCPRWELDAQLNVLLSGFDDSVRQCQMDTYSMLGLAAWLHASFIAIHPFPDGNGRVGRLLASIPLLAAGLPPLVIEASRHIKARYFKALNSYNADKTRPESLIPLMKCFLDNMLLALEAAEANHQPEPGDVIPVIHRLPPPRACFRGLGGDGGQRDINKNIKFQFHSM